MLPVLGKDCVPEQGHFLGGRGELSVWETIQLLQLEASRSWGKSIVPRKCGREINNPY